MQVHPGTGRVGFVLSDSMVISRPFIRSQAAQQCPPGPLATIRHLDQTQANLDRYETWRGKQTGVEAEGPTGADIMRQQMRQRLLLWGGVAAAGVVSVIVGVLLG